MIKNHSFGKMETIVFKNTYIHKEYRVDGKGNILRDKNGEVLFVTNKTPKKRLTLKGMLQGGSLITDGSNYNYKKTKKEDKENSE